ncbi:MAG: phage tail tape measure protein, partial [Clostridiaceae bacterium]|nr:phage tail tape measure protein [Clostridiaceae bacterium]
AEELEEIKKAKMDEALEKIKNAAEKTATALSATAKAAGKVAEVGFKTVTTAVNGGVKALKIYTGAVTGTATALFGLSAQSAAWADDLNTLSQITGLSTEELQKFQYATELIDVDLETLTKSMARNIRSMNSARSGTGATAEAYKKLRVSVTDANGNLRDNQDVFNESIKALGEIESQTERDAIAMELFGRSAQDLTPLIEGGVDAMNELGDSAEKMGLILSQEAIDDLHSFSDSLDILKANASASGRVIAGAFAGKFKIATDIIGDAVPVLAHGFAELFGGDDVEGAANHLTDVLTDLGKDILSKITEELPQFLERFNAFIMAIAESATANLPTVIHEILPALIKGLTDLVKKLTKLLPTLLPMLVDGAMTLFTGILDGLNQVLDLLLPMLPDIVQQICDTLVANLPLIIQGGMTLLTGLITGISTSMPMLIQTIVDMMPMITNTIMVNLPLILQAGIDILLSVIDGIVQMLPSLIPTIVDVIITICDTLLDNLPEIISAAIEIIVAVVQGLAEAIPELVE